MTDLLQNTDLTIGQETTELSAGGGAKYSHTIKSGYYKVEANVYMAMGKVVKANTFGEGKDKSIQDRIRFGFEVMECVLPVDPEAANQVLVKEYGDVKEPYVVTINNHLDFSRSEGENAQYPVIRNAVINALPISVIEKLEAKNLSVSEHYKSLKQVMGQQFIVYIHEEKAKTKDGFSRNHIYFSKSRAKDATAANLAEGIKKEVAAGIEIYALDGGDRVMGTKKLPVLAPTKALRTKMVIWDVEAGDMSQAHLDAAAHEYIYVGEEFSPTDKASPEYCQLLKMQLANGTLQGTAVGLKLESGELKIPDPRSTQQKEEADKVKVDFNDTSEVAEAPFETQPAKPVVTQSAEDAAVEDEASQFDI